MKKLILTIVLATTCGLAQAQTFTANLTPGQEPGTLAGNPSGSGTGTFTLSGTTLSYSITYAGLTAPPSNAHIHQAAPGVNGSVIFGFTAAGTLTAASGSYSGSGNLSEAQITALMAGNTYANIHTATNPGGEIRGQLTLVPEPSTFVMLGAGLALVGWRAFRRK